MANIITYNTFNADNIILTVDKKQVYTNDTYQFKKIYPKYKYPNGSIDDIYVQVPEVLSFGVKTFPNQGILSHNFSFKINVKPNLEEGIDEECADAMNKGLLTIFLDIEKCIKNFLKNSEVCDKLGKKRNAGWDVFVDNIKPVLNFQTDKETGEKIPDASPTLFVKLKTEIGKKNPAIKTVFCIYDASKDDSIVELSASDAVVRLQGKRCTATGVINIESIFISHTNIISIQYKLHEVLVTEINKTDVSRIIIPNRLQKKVCKIFDDSEDDE